MCVNGEMIINQCIWDIDIYIYRYRGTKLSEPPPPNESSGDPRSPLRVAHAADLPNSTALAPSPAVPPDPPLHSSGETGSAAARGSWAPKGPGETSTPRKLGSSKKGKEKQTTSASPHLAHDAHAFEKSVFNHQKHSPPPPPCRVSATWPESAGWPNSCRRAPGGCLHAHQRQARGDPNASACWGHSANGPRVTPWSSRQLLAANHASPSGTPRDQRHGRCGSLEGTTKWKQGRLTKRVHTNSIKTKTSNETSHVRKTNVRVWRMCIDSRGNKPPCNLFSLALPTQSTMAQQSPAGRPCPSHKFWWLPLPPTSLPPVVHPWFWKHGRWIRKLPLLRKFLEWTKPRLWLFYILYFIYVIVGAHIVLRSPVGCLKSNFFVHLET